MKKKQKLKESRKKSVKFLKWNIELLFQKEYININLDIIVVLLESKFVKVPATRVNASTVSVSTF